MKSEELLLLLATLIAKHAEAGTLNSKEQAVLVALSARIEELERALRLLLGPAKSWDEKSAAINAAQAVLEKKP
jgi:hypothetical protein